MNFREFASKIALREGLKKQVSVGNVREVLKITLTELANMPYSEVATLLRRYQGKSKSAVSKKKKREVSLKVKVSIYSVHLPGKSLQSSKMGLIHILVAFIVAIIFSGNGEFKAVYFGFYLLLYLLTVLVYKVYE